MWSSRLTQLVADGHPAVYQSQEAGESNRLLAERFNVSQELQRCEQAGHGKNAQREVEARIGPDRGEGMEDWDTAANG